MEDTQSKVFSFEALFDPVVARAVAARAAQWDLPRYECHPLDRYPGRRVAVTADLAAYDAEIELAPVPEEDDVQELQCDDPGHEVEEDPDYDDDEDFDDDDEF
jgi:hypothetical protein